MDLIHPISQRLDLPLHRVLILTILNRPEDPQHPCRRPAVPRTPEPLVLEVGAHKDVFPQIVRAFVPEVVAVERYLVVCFGDHGLIRGDDAVVGQERWDHVYEIGPIRGGRKKKKIEKEFVFYFILDWNIYAPKLDLRDTMTKRSIVRLGHAGRPKERHLLLRDTREIHSRVPLSRPIRNQRRDAITRRVRRAPVVRHERLRL